MKQDSKGSLEATYLKVSPEKIEQRRFAASDGESRFHELVDQAPALLWMADTEGLFTFFNQTWLNFTGRSFEDELGFGWTQGVHPDDVQIRTQAYNEAFKERKDFSVEYRLRRFDNEFRWILERGKPYYGQSGTFCGYLGSCMDVTETKTAQTVLERHETLLKFLDSTFSNSLRAEDLYQRFANQAVLSFCDWCYIDLLDFTTKMVTRTVIAPPPGFDARALETYKNKMFDLQSGSPSAQAIRESKTILLSNTNGEDKFLNLIHPLSLISSPIYGEHRVIGAATFVVSSARRMLDKQDLNLCEDITHRLSLALENARLYEMAKSSSFLKDEFLATLSHELRTPMTSIVGWSNLLKKGDIDSNTFQVAVCSIEKNALAQASLIDDLLDVSSIVTGQLSLNLQTLNLKQLVANVVSSARHAAENKNIKIQFGLTEDVSITGDDVRLQQALWNILLNAIKYTSPNGQIWIDIELKGQMVVLKIKDNGNGVDPEFLPYMFDSFRQETSGYRRMHGGLGLGLSIAKQIIELHQGTITASSAGSGQGTAIHIELPAKIEKNAIQSKITVQTVEKQDHSNLTSSLAGRRILLIDDAPDIRMIVAYILQREGATTMEAESVEIALENLRRQPADLILCDIGMPHRDGFDFLKAFKSEFKQLTHIAVIALTAFARDEEKTKILAAGFDEHIAKPVNPQLLVKALKERLVR